MTDNEQLANAAACERLRSGRATEIQATGRSMFPYIVHGNRVIVEPCAPDSLRTGELVVFELNGRVILHRVLGVDVSGRSIHEKGDNVWRSTLVPMENVLGRVTAVTARRSRSIEGRRHKISGRWLARFSVWHEWLHLPGSYFKVPRRMLAHGFTLFNRFAGFVLQPR